MSTDERRARAVRLLRAKFGNVSDDDIARAIRAPDEAAGMVLVPREATEEMIQAGANAQYPMGPAEVWRAMIAAATESDNG